MAFPYRALQISVERFGKYLENGIPDTNMQLGEVVYLLIFYNITNSWLLSLTGFNFNILWRDRDREFYKTASFFEKERLIVRMSKIKRFSTLAVIYVILLETVIL